MIWTILGVDDSRPLRPKVSPIMKLAGSRAACRSAGRAGDPVSGARYGLDHRWLPELPAEPAHGDRDGGGEWVGVLVPGLFEEVFGAEHGVVGPHERFEDRELLGGQVEVPPTAAGGVPQGIEFDAGRAEDPGPGGGLAAGECPDSEHQLGEVEGLGQVVVSAEAEAADPVVGGTGRGQHEYHDGLAALGDHPADRVTVHPGQVAVEDDDVIGVDVELGRRVPAFVRHINGHAVIPQALGDAIGQALCVLDDQHPHAGARRGTGAPASAGTARGSSMITWKPPVVGAYSCSLPPWISAMAATIDSPRPLPRSEPVRSVPSRWNGWVSCWTSCSSSTGPPFSTTRRATAPAMLVWIRTQPPGALWVMALSTRLPTMRASSVALPLTRAPGHC